MFLHVLDTTSCKTIISDCVTLNFEVKMTHLSGRRDDRVWDRNIVNLYLEKAAWINDPAAFTQNNA